jgi:uncharacterized protein (TIGR03118 family)
VKHLKPCTLSVLGILLLAVAPAFAQANAYQQTNLVSDVAGMANHTDPKLINPWGISFLPGQPFWIADNNSGFSTQYDAAGNSQLPTVTVPGPGGSQGTPTGTVANSTSGFVVGTGPALFLFDAEDGTISGWNGTGTTAITAVDNSVAGAVYKGLAMVTTGGANFLLATNFNSGKVEVYDSAFKAASLSGSFTDPNLPAGYAPFGIQVIGTQIYVTYAVQDSAKHDPISAAGNGIVSIFDFNGNFVKRFASNGMLNSPWGVVMTPAGFGAFAGDILVGNFGDGTINAFDSAGTFLGQMQDAGGNVISNSGLWALVFGAGGTGNPGTLYFTAGLAGETHGLFGTLDVSTGGGTNSPDFSFAANPQSATVTAGNSTTYMLSVSPVNGFTNTVTFTCSGGTGISCTFNPPSVTPTGASATTTMTVHTSSGVTHYGPMALFLPVGLVGAVMIGAGKKQTLASKCLAAIFVIVLSGTMLESIGCGGGSSNGMTNLGTASIAVTATSGTLMHTTMVTLTVQ